MKLLSKLAIAALVSASFVTGFSAGGALAANLKEAKDVRIAFVVHGSASDPYWSVVKNGVLPNSVRLARIGTFTAALNLR